LIVSDAGLRTLKDIAARSKGWPVGIPADDRVAKGLVASGHLEYAPPAYNYQSNPRTYRLTTLGKLVVDGRLSLS
jgi:hypothetical protein